MVVRCVTPAFVCIFKPQFWIPKRFVSSLPKDVKRRICLQMPKCQSIVIPCPLQDKSNFQRFLLLLNFQEKDRVHVLQFLADYFCLKPQLEANAYGDSSLTSGTELVKDFPGQLIVRIPITKNMTGTRDNRPMNHSSTSFKMSAIFSIMVNGAHEHGITDWAVSQVGLNEIFQSVLTKARSLQEEQSKHTDGCDNSSNSIP